MKVILQTDIGKIGKKHDIVDVADGYARNYLIPRKFAEIATPEKEAAIERQREKRAAEEEAHQTELKKALEALQSDGVTITASASDQGHLYAGLHTDDVASKLSEQSGVSVAPTALEQDDSIKEVGSYEIAVRVGDEKVLVPLEVVATEQAAEQTAG